MMMHQADSQHYPASLREAERQRIGERRAAYEEGANQPADARVGIALSGGGIRSATQSLGFFQALARNELLHRIDFMSTVSGGGYFGGFLGAWFTRQPRKGRLHEEVKEQLERGTGPVAWLRNNSNYLAPNGAGDLTLAVTILLRNWLSMLVVMGTAAIVLFLAARGIACVVGKPFAHGVEVHVFLLSSWLALAVPPFVLAVGVAWAYWLVPSKNDDTGRVYAWAGAGVALLGGAVILILGLTSRKSEAGSTGVVITGVLILVVVLTAMISAWWIEHRDYPRWGNRLHASRLLRSLLSVVAVAFLFGFVDSLGLISYRSVVGGDWGWAAAIVSALAVLASCARTIAVKKPDPDASPVRSKFLAFAVELFAGPAVAVIMVSAVAFVSHAATWCGAKPLSECLLPVRTERDVELTAEGYVRVVQKKKNDTNRKAAGSARADRAEESSRGGKDRSSEAGRPRDAKSKEARKANADQAGAGEMDTGTAAARPNWLLVIILLVLAFVLSLHWRCDWPFVNRSSFHRFYHARLTRAFLGASNPARRNHPDEYGNITQLHRCDDVPFEQYSAFESGGPLHLVNVTVNETIEGRSQLQQLHRKGVGMAVGPAGVSVGAHHHALWDRDRGKLESLTERGELPAEHSVFPPKGDLRSTSKLEKVEYEAESLTLGEWLAISGAAASTGMGYRTSIGKSLLCGLFNVRLGYWWDSDVERQGSNPSHLSRVKRSSFVQRSLLNEYLARFPGTARCHWYLSDGGHFENLGAYELVRRRIPLIIVCDFEQDTRYRFAGLGNLVRKVRIDFGARIRFLTAEDLDGTVHEDLRDAFGTLPELRPKKRPNCPDECTRSRATFSLARVEYPDAKTVSWLIYVKPGIRGDEPADVAQYRAANPDFPQQPTSDQFFDEQQWEAYRCLAEYLGDQLLRFPKDSAGSGVTPLEWIQTDAQPPWPPDPEATKKKTTRKKTTTKKKTAKKKTATKKKTT